MIYYKALLLLILTTVAIRASDDHHHEESDHNHDNDFYKGHSKCNHDQLEHNPKFLDVEETIISAEEGRLLAASSYPKIRIYPYYSILYASAPAPYTSYVQNQLVPPIVAYFQGALRLKAPLSGNLQVPSVQSDLCGKSTPSVLLNGGVDADFFIFFDSEYDDSSSSVAASTVCFMSTTTQRPLITTTKFNRAQFKNPGSDVLLQEKNTYLLIHEMIHTFGFSTSLYPFFLDSNGKTRTGHISSGTIDGTTSLVLNTPTLTQKLRNFFGCSSLTGAYMENTGSSATAGSHFERRHSVYEVMSSGLIYEQRVSEMTFALLEDSGWYVPDYSFAEPYHFGEGQGCGFLFNSCTDSSFNFEEFCKASTSTRGCTFQGRGSGTCQSDIRSDGCKYYAPNVNNDCENPNSANFARLASIQTFGRTANSKCFDGSLASTSEGATQTGFCLKYSCQGSDTGTVLAIQLGNKKVTCKHEGPVTVSGYYGSINCPDPETFCSSVGETFCPRNCMNRGSCSNGKCVCYKGFQGKDCGLNV